jgi:F-type H+-transporting ATPase subunit a
MKFSPDHYIFFSWSWGHLNATILLTWFEMALIVIGSWLATRKMTGETAITLWQNLIETLVDAMAGHIEDITHQKPERFLPFVGTLFIFIIVSNVLAAVPYYIAPTGSLSTTTALALCVFFAVPIFGLADRSILSYLSQYVKPTVLMLPFNILGEISRTFALAVRLYGNLMSGTIVGVVLMLIMPLFFPVVMSALGLLTGVIQAYIFALLAMVYIASALQKEDAGRQENNE